MNKQKIKYTVAFQLVCFSTILWVFAASETSIEAKVAQQAATPDEDRRVIAWDRENNSSHTAELTIWYTVP
jgi:hypothetical protein